MSMCVKDISFLVTLESPKLLHHFLRPVVHSFAQPALFSAVSVRGDGRHERKPSFDPAELKVK